jgi:acyl dehydratase
MAGLWFDQFEVGRRFHHEIRRTVTEADNMWFCNATYNPAAIHIDAE